MNCEHFSFDIFKDTSGDTSRYTICLFDLLESL